MAAVAVGTPAGLSLIHPGAGEASTRYLEGLPVRAVARQGSLRLWALADESEIWCSDNGGPWRAVADVARVHAGLRAHCLADTRANQPGGILVGTSEAHLVRVAGDGTPELVQAFDAAPERERWYTPWGAPADVRTISEDDQSVYVNVHVGGVLRSRDAGASWQPTIDVDADVHRVVSGHGRVYAAGAYGLSVSDDGGDTWRLVTDGLHARYCRGAAVCGDTVLVSVSGGPSGHAAALYRTGADPRRLERCRTGLPEWFGDNVDSHSLDALPDGSLAAAGTHSGEVYISRDQGASWELAADGLGAVSCLLVLP